MSFAEKKKYKQRLQQLGAGILEQRIARIRSAMNEAQENANRKEKSSAGDKYETSRAMSHLQKDMYSTQLSSNIKEMENLLSADCRNVYETVQRGSLVDCGDFAVFVTAGLGKVNFEGKTIFFVSAMAPLAKTLLGKKAGDTFFFKQQELKINEAF